MYKIIARNLSEKLGRNPDFRVVMTNYVCMYVGTVFESLHTDGTNRS